MDDLKRKRCHITNACELFTLGAQIHLERSQAESSSIEEMKRTYATELERSAAFAQRQTSSSIIAYFSFASKNFVQTKVF